MEKEIFVAFKNDLKEYIDNRKADYDNTIHLIIGYITATATMSEEYVFTAGQLRELFNLDDNSVEEKEGETCR